MIQSERGSMWRKWDLQIHTPYSYLNNSGFPSDFKDYLREVIQVADTEKISAIGLTDYFSIEGYTHATSLLKDATFLASLDDSSRKRARDLLWLPNVELRTNFLIQRNGQDSRVNMHVIFSDQLTCEEIDEHFFRVVKFWDESEPQSSQNKRLLTVTNLTDLGRRLKNQHPQFASNSDVFVGMMNAVVDANEVASVLASHSVFQHKYLIMFPCDEDLSEVSWNSQGHLSRKQCIQMSDGLISSNEQTRLFGLGYKHPSIADFVSEFKSRKPCISTSDAHSIAELFRPFESRHTWIKADVTFDGLRQVIHEPEHRIFIGDTPAQITLVRERPTQYMNQIKVVRAPSTPIASGWFSDFEIPLSPGLVAIIGKKGSGKSALSDLIAFAGFSKQLDHFSFLNAKRFWNDNKKRARSFNVELLWHDKKLTNMRLSDDRPVSTAEEVKYIPQNYLELICNELDQGEASAFQRELQEVIFSHIPLAERNGATTLDELLRFKNAAIEERLRIVKAQIHELNRQVFEIEEKSSPKERARLTNLLSEKKREVEAHAEIKPKPEPEADESEQAAASSAQKQLQDAQAALITAEAALALIVADRVAKLTVVNHCSELLLALDNLELSFKNLTSRVTELAQKAGFDPAQLIRLSIKRDDIKSKSTTAEASVKLLDQKLDAEVEDSEAHTVRQLEQKVESIQKGLTEPERKRQIAKQAQLAWEKKRGELIGDVNVPGSQKHLEARIVELNLLPGQVVQLKKDRDETLLTLFDAIAGLGEEYDNLFGPVKAFFEHHKSELKDVSVSFVVSQKVSSFTLKLLGYLDQGKKGAFRGLEEGKKIADDLVKQGDFQTRTGIQKFVNSIIAKLESSSGTTLDDQLAKGRTKAELMDFVFGLDYVRPRFDLLWDDKPPEQLSPGERGTLLLVFYFVLDMRTYPLIIDQPEENLDNETIYKVLVPCIMFAKQRRQVVMVTHNPNLAVAADADQIIYARVEKEPSLELSYEAGAIESPSMTNHVINVLEGTRPAFQKREARYESHPVTG